MEENIEKKFFVFQIIAFELELQILTTWNSILLIACQCVLTDNSNISSDTMGDIFQINFPENDEKT